MSKTIMRVILSEIRVSIFLRISFLNMSLSCYTVLLIFSGKEEGGEDGE